MGAGWERGPHFSRSSSSISVSCMTSGSQSVAHCDDMVSGWNSSGTLVCATICTPTEVAGLLSRWLTPWLSSRKRCSAGHGRMGAQRSLAKWIQSGRRPLGARCLAAVRARANMPETMLKEKRISP